MRSRDGRFAHSDGQLKYGIIVNLRGREGTLRQLTNVEAQVIQALLESSPDSEQNIIKRTQLARSTFQYARRRCYSKGWIYDRYIPSVPILGKIKITVGMIWPSSGNMGKYLDALKHDTACILAWHTYNMIFYVLFSEEYPAAEELCSGQETASVERHIVVPCQSTASSVPVFFDMSGSISKVFALKRPATYPVTIFEDLSDADHPVRTTMGNAGQSLYELMALGQANQKKWVLRSAPPFPLSLPKSFVKLIEENKVYWRVFPDLRSLPGFGGRTITDVIFAHGKLREMTSGPRLLEELVSAFDVFPFLLGLDIQSIRGDAILAFLGVKGGLGDGTSREKGKNVQAFLQERMDDISIVREPMAAVEVTVDHRYQELVKDRSTAASEL